MKKILAILAVCILLGGMSTVTAVTIPQMNAVKELEKNAISTSEKLYSPTGEDWSGKFIGAFGELKKVGEEWNFTKWGYLAGVYKGGNKGKFYGNLYDLNETQFGNIGGYFGKSILIGRIKIGCKKAPIVSFLFHNETMFIGRIMSLIGPAPHIIGYHWAC